MPTKTESQLKELEIQIVMLKEQVRNLSDKIHDAHLLEISSKLAVLESQLGELKRREEEQERRRWQFWLGVGIVVITFVANLTINLLMFFAKKPS